MEKPELEGVVEGLGEIYQISAPWNVGIRALRRKPAKPLISARNLAYARVKTGADSIFSQKGSYVDESPVYVPDKTLFVRHSPLLNQKLAEQAVQAHKNSSEFYIGNGLADKRQKQAC